MAYFQQGVSNFLLGDFEEALANFNDTLLYLRGNTMIDYAQLGLLFKLYSCEVLFNRGLCYIYLQQKDAGLQDLNFAVKEKVVEDHNVIDDAIREEAEVITPGDSSVDGHKGPEEQLADRTTRQGYTVFSIPVGVVYRPNDAKVRNLKTKDYLGKARLVAASDRANAFTGFTGSEIKNAGKTDVKDDRPADNISFAATNLVKPGLQSRRQQSEPPNSRNVFPPTPPPENDKPTTMSRGASVRNGPKPMPAKLNIDKARPNDRYERTSPQEQRRPQRAASATPSRAYSQRGDPRRRPTSREEEEGYLDDVYDTYGTGSGGGGSLRGSRSQRRPPPQQRYIEEEDEGSDFDDGSFDEGDFEMVSNRRPGTNSMSGSQRGASRRPDIRNIKVKVHYTATDDTRMILIGAACEYGSFVDQVRNKFKIPSRRGIKIKVRDDDGSGGPTDMITMGDQDDLDMAIMNSKSTARRERQENGKMEVRVKLGRDACCFMPWSW